MMLLHADVITSFIKRSTKWYGRLSYVSDTFTSSSVFIEHLYITFVRLEYLFRTPLLEKYHQFMILYTNIASAIIFFLIITLCMCKSLHIVVISSITEYEPRNGDHLISNVLSRLNHVGLQLQYLFKIESCKMPIPTSILD